MSTLFDLQLDRSLRRKLILICLSVAVIVSIIYSVVAFRLSSEMGINTEISYLEKRSLFLLAEIEEEGDAAQLRIKELIRMMQHAEGDGPQPIYVEVLGHHDRWQLNTDIPGQTLDIIKNEIQQKQVAGKNSGFIKYQDEYFLWSAQNLDNNAILMVIVSNSINDTMSHIAKRLAITSAVVFWIAVWLALTLSSWIAKRVEDKNEALRRLASHDSLTGLPNRLYLVDLLQTQQKHTEKSVKGTLLTIDLDKFKEINDTLGHSAGDKLLVIFAQNLAQVLSPEQTLFRSSGDEFLIWAPDISAEGCEAFAAQIVESLQQPICMNELPIHLEASIGIALCPEHSSDIDTLLISADIAMHEAKKLRSKWALFNKSHANDEKGQQTLRYRSELSEALAEQQIKLFYQPKVNLTSGKIVAAEALARWQHPVDGMLPPLLFIPLIEQSGKVREFGRYVIRHAIKQLSIWKTQGIMVPVAVNLSPYNLLDPDIVSYTQELCEKADIPPNMLEIELTETATSLHLHTISASLNRFKDIGVSISIDDFGTGMSSLAYISNLNVDTIKIDRSFISDIETNSSNLSIVTSALNLAKAFNCTVVAEGVENLEQATLLNKLGCHYGQGYYYSAPVPADKFTALLKFTPTLSVS
ncbi:putative bifunctional diguanylate cyclase/phosphodiesterase [Marinomonas fungiae]|uniref:putative bifunctional diguanylate cyclase/phosphodiesterase n=1 Tax=Marinomonas fungiae TaxID=1137284 RepID=UPI003A91CE5C